MEAIILAGGVGKRLQSVVCDVPKPMAPVPKRPFLELLIDFWIAQGIERLILAIGYKHELIETHFGRYYKGIPVDYSVETAPLGTGGGLLNVLRTTRDLEESFLVLNGDTYFEVSLELLSRFHREHKSDWTVALKTGAEENRYGTVEIDSAAKIMTFKEKAESLKIALMNGGVYLINRSVLENFPYDFSRPMSLEKELLPALIQTGKQLFGFSSRGKFIDIGIPEDYHKASKMFA